MAATVVALPDRVRSREIAPERVETTLLALVQTIAEVTEDEAEIVATVLHLLRSGRVRLCGTLRDEPLPIA